MGYDLNLHNKSKADADGIDYCFSDLPLAIHGMGRLGNALSACLTKELAYKMSFNDGKVITPEECALMADHLDGLLKQGAPEVQERPELFVDWSRFCRTAVNYGGIEVW